MDEAPTGVLCPLCNMLADMYVRSSDGNSKSSQAQLLQVISDGWLMDGLAKSFAFFSIETQRQQHELSEAPIASGCLSATCKIVRKHLNTNAATT